MARVPVKLSRGEIVLPPRVAQQYRQRLEQMNAKGLQVRNMGGMIQYRQEGGGIQGTLDNLSSQASDFLNNPATGQVGEFLYNTGQNVSNAIDAFDVDPKTKGAYTEKLNELYNLLTSGQITQAQYDTAKNDLLGVKVTSAAELKSIEERAQAGRESIDAATKAIQLIDAGAGEVLNYIARSWSEILSGESWSSLLSDLTTATASFITGQERKTVETAAHSKFADTKQWNAYKLYTQEIKLLQLKARSLVKGGSISDSEGAAAAETIATQYTICLLYTSPSPRDRQKSRMPSSA